MNITTRKPMLTALFFLAVFTFLMFGYTKIKALPTEANQTIILNSIDDIHKTKKSNVSYELIETLDIEISGDYQQITHDNNGYVGMLYSFADIDCPVDFEASLENEISEGGFMGKNLTVYVDGSPEEYRFKYKYGNVEKYTERYEERYVKETEVTAGKLNVYGVVQNG